MHNLQILAQMIDVELSHVLWALVAVIGFFIKRELSKIHEDIKGLSERVESNTMDLVKVKSKLEIE